MKQYIIEPQVKKSVVEIQTYRKEINETMHYLRYEDCWRWGGFVLSVPETPDELEDWAKTRGYDAFAEFCEDYEFNPETDDIKEYALPEEDDDAVMIYEDYGWNAEMIETWDGGCWSEWTISAYGEGALTEEEREEACEHLADVYWESYEEGLAEEGWEESDVDYVIYNGFNLREVPEGKNPYEVYNEGSV